QCQAAAECHLGGGAALSGAWLGHRLSRDIDLFFHDREQQRQLVKEVPSIAADSGFAFRLVRDGGAHVRGVLQAKSLSVEVDIVYEPALDLEPPPPPIDGIIVQSL